MKKRILFVDDDSNILDGLRRLLRSMRHEWEMAFASSARAAMDHLDGGGCDLIVTDVRMPETNGVQLLEMVKRKYPRVIRVILSGHADEHLVYDSILTTHQFLAKPCEAETLISTLVRATELRTLLENPNMESIVGSIGALPSSPHVRAELVAELQAAEPQIRGIGETVAKDMSMAAKALQLANSAFFGLPRPISNPVEAVSNLGIERIQHLASEAMPGLLEEDFTRLGLDRLWGHSLTAAIVAREIATMEQTNRRVIYEAYSGGLLHDVGKLVLAMAQPDGFRRAMTLAAEKGMPVWEAERRVFGVSHDAIGGYLLGLWGLPDAVVEAVAFHHRPSELQRTTFGALTAVHAANAIAHEGDASPELDRRYLAAQGLEHRLPAWIESCRSI